MFKRTLTPYLQKIAQQMPIVAILGPRQSGKTTIAKMTWADYHYVSLEDLDHRAHATQDPRGFLQQFQDKPGVIIDEFQNVPTLPSYLQTHVDTHQKNGFFILTGSQNFLVNQAISQSLAGRVAILSLFPLSLPELKINDIVPSSLKALFFTGSYPRVYLEKLSPTTWYRDYTLTYLERDVRSLEKVVDLTIFKKFLQLCAGRVGQLLNISALANDCGISQATAKGWLSILEASYLIFLLQPHFNNFNKRLVKTPKLYFYDTGLTCSLLGIDSADQLTRHFAFGALMENWVIADLHKQRCHTHQTPHLYFWRDNHGDEIDCIMQTALDLTPIEIKSGQTIATDFFKGLNKWNTLADKDPANSFLVYGGDQNQTRSSGTVLGWQSLDEIWTMIDSRNKQR